jgi:Zn-dependent protease
VLLAEPPRTQFDLNFSLLGIPVRVQPFFWLIGLLLGPRGVGAPEIAIWMAAFFVGILCHEMGHALVMRSQGGFAWITLYGFGGMASCDRLRNVSSTRIEALRQILISAAGPLAGFLLAAIVVGAMIACGHTVQIIVGAPYGVMIQPAPGDIISGIRLTHWIDSFLFVTVVYGILNLLPIHPLDGGKIMRELFVLFLGTDGIRQSLILSTFVAGMIAVWGVMHVHDIFFIFFFGYLAYGSLMTLQSYRGRNPW